MAASAPFPCGFLVSTGLRGDLSRAVPRVQSVLAAAVVLPEGSVVEDAGNYFTPATGVQRGVSFLLANPEQHAATSTGRPDCADLFCKLAAPFANAAGAAAKKGGKEKHQPPQVTPLQCVVSSQSQLDKALYQLSACLVASSTAGGSPLPSSYAVAFHVRGDDQHGAADVGGGPWLDKKVSLEATARALAATPGLLPLSSSVSLKSPDLVVVFRMWRGGTSESLIPKPVSHSAGGEEAPPPPAPSPNDHTPYLCGVSFLPACACRINSAGIVPLAIPSFIPVSAPPGARQGGGVGGGEGQEVKSRKRKDRKGGRDESGGTANTSGGAGGGFDGSIDSHMGMNSERGGMARAKNEGCPSSQTTACPDADAQAAQAAAAPSLLHKALDSRFPALVGLRAEGTDCYRLVNGSGDGLDGLTVDQYGGHLLTYIDSITGVAAASTPVAQTGSAGAVLVVEQHRKWASPDSLIAALQLLVEASSPSSAGTVSQCSGVKAIILKKRHSQSSGDRSGVVVWSGGSDKVYVDCDTGGGGEGVVKGGGGESGMPVLVHEAGMTFHLHMRSEEHVGVFLDSRPARALVRSMCGPAVRTVLNLFSYTCGFGLAAACGGAVRTVNVDNKGGCLSSGKSNYKATLGGSGGEYEVDERSFSKECSMAALSRLSQLGGSTVAGSASSALYDLVVVDPPPRFHQKSRIHFEAERDYGHLLAQCFRATAGPGSHVLAGLNALTVSDELFAAMVDEAAASTGMKLTRVKEVGAGPDFEPPCPFRPTARFVLLRRET